MGQVARGRIQSPQGVCSRHCGGGVVRELHEMAVKVEDAGVLHSSRSPNGLHAGTGKKRRGNGIVWSVASVGFARLSTKHVHTSDR